MTLYRELNHCLFCRTLAFTQALMVIYRACVGNVETSRPLLTHRERDSIVRVHPPFPRTKVPWHEATYRTCVLCRLFHLRVFLLTT